jgi:hypothetical protein
MCERAEKSKLGMAIARQADAVITAAPDAYARLLGAVGRVESEGVVLA